MASEKRRPTKHSTGSDSTEAVDAFMSTLEGIVLQWIGHL